jgi:hypothetical protein
MLILKAVGGGDIHQISFSCNVQKKKNLFIMYAFSELTSSLKSVGMCYVRSHLVAHCFIDF